MNYLLGIVCFILVCVAVFKDIELQKLKNETEKTTHTLTKGNLVLDYMRKEISRDDAILAGIFGKWNRHNGLASLPVDVSVYTSRVKETDSTPFETADMSLVKRGILAVSRDLKEEVGLEFGQRVLLDGYGVFEIHDIMNKRYKRRVDIWSSDLKAAMKHGVKKNIKLTWAL